MASTILAAAVVSLLLAPSAAARPAAAPPTPWGPVHRVAADIVRQDAHVVTSSRGLSVVTWQARLSHGHFDVQAAVRSQGGRWSPAVRLSDRHEQAAAVTSVAWGGGNVSVFWEREVATDDWQFRMRTVGPDGAWRPARTLLTAHYAFPGFQADVNDAGAILLSWENGDHRVRSAVLGTDGPWRRLRPIAVKSPGTTFRFIDNPRAAFLADGRDVRIVAWGRHRGTSGRALWSARLGRDGRWRYARIGPTGGDRLEYNWVGQAEFAADGQGDFAAVWPQQDAKTHRWTTLLRYDPRGPARGVAHVLGHARCDPDWNWCADVAMGDAGDTTVAWARPGADAQRIVVARRHRHGHVTKPQTIYAETVRYIFDGVAVSADARGDAVVTFLGGNRKVFFRKIARCPIGLACGRPLNARGDRPSWLDPLSVSVAPAGGAVLAWVTGCGGGGEACRPTHVWARHLNAMR